MSGFVYVWFDKKRNMFYIGCHWGREDDGYVCSSTRMRNAYNRRPSDFKRRIVSRITSNRTDLLQKEYEWLCLIPDDELGKRYYNASKRHFGHWSAEDHLRQQVSNKLRGRTHTSETKQQISKKGKGRFWITNGTLSKTIHPGAEIPNGWIKGRGTSPYKGKSRSKESIARMTEERRKRSGWSKSEETRKKLSVAHTGKKLSSEHVEAIKRTKRANRLCNATINK
jgi:hypothetical protein